MFKLNFVGFSASVVAFACVACGGTIDGDSSASSSASAFLAPDPALGVAPASTDADAGSDAQADAHESAPNFVCRITLASTQMDLGCGTLSDGGASYYDTSANMDCRVYFQGAGQGCVPDMDCHAWIDLPTANHTPSGELTLAQGTCVDRSKK